MTATVTSSDSSVVGLFRWFLVGLAFGMGFHIAGNVLAWIAALIGGR